MMNLYKTIEIGKNINTTAAHIYNVLCELEGKTLIANELAELLGMTSRSFFRATKALKEEGYINIEQVRHETEGYKTGCIYHIVGGNK